MHHHVDPNMIFEENRLLGDAGSKMMKIGAALGLLGLIASLILAFTGGWERFHQAWLVSFSFWLSIALGGLLFTILQHLTKAGWSTTIRRIAELIGATVPVFFLLALPIMVPALLHSDILYPWASQDTMLAHHHLHHKAGYYSPLFVGLRLVLYFGVWFWLSRRFLGWSLAQDKDGDTKWTGKMQAFAAPSTLLMALTITFLSFDLLMSLDPFWFSTIFGVYFFAGGFLGFFATMILGLRKLQKSGRLSNAVNVEHYQDLGKWLFAFVFFWGYIAFCQFMLIWYGDLPEELTFYRRRMSDGWLNVSYFLLFGHFVIPFAGLLSRHVKRKLPLLSAWAIAMLFLHWVDMQWMVMPSKVSLLVAEGESAAQPAIFHVMDLTVFLAMTGFVLAGFAWVARDKSLVCERDPFLTEALSFKNF